MGRLWGPEPQGPGPFQLDSGPGGIVQGQVCPTQRVGTRRRGQRASGLDLLGESLHPSPEVRLIAGQIPRRLDPKVSAEGLDALGGLGEALSVSSLGLGPQPFPHGETAEDRDGKADRDRSRHQGLALPRPVDHPLHRCRGAGLDGFSIQNAVEVLPQRAGGGVPAPRVLLEAGEHHGIEIRRDGGDSNPDRHRVVFHDARHAFESFPSEGRIPGQHLIEGDAQGVDIRPAVQQGRVPARLLGGHVADGAHHLAGLGELPTLDAPGQPEVEHAGPGGPVVQPLHHQVGRVQVPVDEADAMGRMDALADLRHQAEQRLQRHRGCGLQQGLPGNELHDDVGLSAPLAHFMHPTDVRVIDPGLELGLLDEPTEEVRVVPTEELQGHHPAEAGICGPEHATHAAFAKK